MADERPIDWEDWIVVDPEVMVGKPVVKGTRITAEFVLQLLAAGSTEATILDSYAPSLTPEAMRGIYAFAAQVVGEQRFFGVPLPAQPKPKGDHDAPPRR